MNDIKNQLKKGFTKSKDVVAFVKPAIVGMMILGASGASAATGTTAPTTLTSVKDVVDSLCNIFGWMFVGLIAVSTIMGVWAAFIYVTADGDAEKVSKATKTLTYVAIGVAVALLAKAVPLIIGSFFGVSSTDIPSC